MLEARNDGLKHGNNGKGGKIAAGGVFWVHLFVKLAFCEEIKIALYSRLLLPKPGSLNEEYGKFKKARPVQLLNISLALFLLILIILSLLFQTYLQDTRIRKIHSHQEVIMCQFLQGL